MIGRVLPQPLTPYQRALLLVVALLGAAAALGLGFLIGAIARAVPFT